VVAGLVVGWGWFLFCALVFGGRLQRLGEPLEQADEQTERRDDEVVTPACSDGVGHRAAADDEGRRARS
jgi:hypothetical protein